LKISVVLALYNGERFIVDQINSILSQTLPVDEIIVIDDASSDNSKRFIDNLIERNKIIKVFRNQYNKGVVKSIEIGLNYATGDYIFLSDQDDIWVENKVKIFCDYFLLYPSMRLFYSNGVIVDTNLNSILTLNQHYYKNYSELTSNRIMHSLMMANFIPGATMAVKREFANILVPFPESKYVLHDGWLAIVSHIMNYSVYIPQELIYYRRHNQNYTAIFDDASILKKICRSIHYRNLELYFLNISRSFLSISHLLYDSKYSEVSVFRDYYESIQSKGLNKVLVKRHLKSIYKITFLLIRIGSYIFLFKLVLFVILSLFRNLLKIESTNQF